METTAWSAHSLILKCLRTIKIALLSFFGKTTVGARVILLDGNKILLVKHTYMPGWYTIGGSVDAGESALQALHRELKEEVGVTLLDPPSIFSIYYNIHEGHDDHVVLYIAKKFRQVPVKCEEILEERWFDIDKLPQDITPATKRRIEEYLGLIPVSDRW